MALFYGGLFEAVDAAMHEAHMRGEARAHAAIKAVLDEIGRQGSIIATKPPNDRWYADYRRQVEAGR